jgi:hypothetical protein
MKYQISSLTILTPQKALKTHHVFKATSYSCFKKTRVSGWPSYDAHPLTEAELLDADSQIHTRKTKDTKYQNSSLTILAKKKL